MKTIRSQSFKRVSLIRSMRCEAGHVFNGAGCKVCPYCTAERYAKLYAEQAGRPFAPSPRLAG